ncbi:hypothetical protein A8L34_25890 [Bacillus sp. FJAT-27264]|nr:hypothetical protein A8L34_25890 [Bacillus sp. FJAT-27264]
MNQGFQIEGACEINEKFIFAYNSALTGYVAITNNPFLKKKIVRHNDISESTDVSSIETQKKIASLYKGVTGIIGGPPCQDYSIGGKNKGIQGERGKLILSYYNIVAQVKPLFLLFENVEGLYRTKAHNIGFTQMINNLQDLGYSLWFDIINPLNYGFPQDRPRVIVVAFRNEVIETLLSNGYIHEMDNEVLKRTESPHYIFKWPKIIFEDPKKSISWPKKWDFGSEVLETEVSRIPQEYNSLLVKNYIDDLNNSIPNQNEVFNPISDKFLRIQEGDTNRKSFKRIHRYRYSPTVAYGNNEVHLHPTEPRRLTVREALRIQTVPDTYILPRDIPLSTKFKMISNGVPSGQAELIAKEIRITLEKYFNLV